jgi:hypothetical protein
VLIQDARGATALINVLVQVVVGFAVLFGGYALARR